MKVLNKQASHYVSMANELIKAAHNLTLMEKRVLMLAISKIDSKAKPHVNSIVKLTVNEFVAEFGIDKDSAYRDVKKAVQGVRRRYARFFYNDLNGKIRDRDISWTSYADYMDSEGWIELSINGDLNPYLYELKSHFTSYKLSRASALRSVYSWRILELLLQYKSTGLLNIGIDEFIRIMELTSSYIKDFGAMRRKVIEPAVKEIREKDGLKVNWEAIKTGRKVTGLKFTFPPEKLDMQPKPAPKYPTRSDAELEQIDKPMTKQEAAQVSSQIIGKAKKVGAEIMPLDELKSRLKSAQELASASGDVVDTFLTNADRKAIKHYQIKV